MLILWQRMKRLLWRSARRCNCFSWWIDFGPVKICRNIGVMFITREANEVMYKMSEHILKKMQEKDLISQEEREEIAVLNMETFSPELAKVYL